MKLTNEQQHALDLYISKKNIFITGPGGCGKSFIIKKFVSVAKTNGFKYQVCALTGCAALLLESKAKTIHSWAGIGLANEENSIIVKKIFKNKYKKHRWQNIDVLIIDEISMMSKRLFELIDELAKKCRKNNKPFGGIQVVFCGDFYQLPPISKNNDKIQFCFESPLFDITFPNKIVFTKIFRQNDLVYTKILNQIRVGRITKNTIKILKSCVDKKIPDNLEIKPTVLLPIRHMVNTINRNSMNELHNEKKIYKISKKTTPYSELSKTELNIMENASKSSIDYEYNYLLKNINCTHTLELAIGSQVMCITNLDLTNTKYPICNGSQGILINFTSDNLPIVKFKNGCIKTIGYHTWTSENLPGVCIIQIPLILSWAITIHKSQGATLDFAEIDIGNNIFECGQTYVALSRIVNLDGLYLKSFNPYKIKINKKVKEFYRNL